MGSHLAPIDGFTEQWRLSDRGSEFVSHFFRSLGKALDMKLHFISGDALNSTLEGETNQHTPR